MQWKVRLSVQVHILFLLETNVCIHGVKHDDYRVNVAKLAALTQGTELVILENAIHNRKSYKVEDFFWTGSGDGHPDDDNQWSSGDTTTVYSTKTVLSTIYVTSNTFGNQTNATNTPCVINCEPVTPHEDINPTPTYPSEIPEDESDADRHFWLLTVLKSDGKEPDVPELKRNLANLYKKAFLRQQAKHLGIQSKTKRETKVDKPINVYIHKIEKLPSNGDEKIEVIYHVAVSGQPVDAFTAAEDMRLVTDAEVKEELGYPFLVKAEPYIKPTAPQELANTKPQWLILGISVMVVIILLLAIACLTICISKRQDARGTENRQQVFEDQSGHDNKAYEKDKHEKGYKSGRRNQNPSPTYINFRSRPSNETLISGINVSRPHSRSSMSSSSGSIDISPLMGLGKQRNSAKRVLRPKAAINKTTPLVLNKRPSFTADTDSSSMGNSPDTIFIGNCDPGVVSPKSYLSMPSVKSFPRGNNPEPLNKVLEPVSVLHLDMADDPYYDQQPLKDVDYRIFARHGSVGTSEDPGVIGPVVWNMHCNRLQHGVSVDEGMDEMKIGSNVSKMRKRFHDLLDDTFSLFGSRRESPIKEVANTPIEVKSLSAMDKSYDVPTVKVRPKTSDPKRSNVSTISDPPKGAWMSTAPSPLVRPLSAPYIRPNTAPRVDMDHILAEGTLSQNDPAIPLIAAIKKEIGKCALPGSTTNIHE